MSLAIPGLGAVVLAGGRSTRMGTDKAALTVGGRSVLARVVSTLGVVCEEIVLVARRGQDLPALEPLPAHVRLARTDDQVEGRGPLAGLAAGLRVLTRESAFASSCDVPFLRPDLVRVLAQALGTASVALPEVEGRLHPLAGVYRRATVLPEAEALLAQDRLRPVFLLERLPHVRVGEAALKQADPDLRSLLNMNTPAEHAAAEALAKRLAVPVELYGIAAQRAGRPVVRAEGVSLREVLLDLEQRVPALSGEVLAGGATQPHWVASVDGGRFMHTDDEPLPAGARVLLLSSLAGG